MHNCQTIKSLPFKTMTKPADSIYQEECIRPVNRLASKALLELTRGKVELHADHRITMEILQMKSWNVLEFRNFTVVRSHSGKDKLWCECVLARV